MAPGESQESSPGVVEKGDSAGEVTPLPDNRSELRLHSSENIALNSSTSTLQRRPESITAKSLQSSAPGMAASAGLLRPPDTDSISGVSQRSVSDRRNSS